MAEQYAGLASPLVPRSMQALRPRLTPFLAAAIFGAALVSGVAPARVAVSQPAAPTFADGLDVDGLVAQPRRFSRDDLAALATWTMQVVFAAGQQVQSAAFTGPSLVVLAWGEIDPEFGAEPVFVGYERDGQPLDDGEGMARLVVAGDKRGGRHVTRLSHLEVRDVGGVAAGGGTQ